MNEDLSILNREIMDCEKCSRLVEFRNSVLKDTRKYANEIFWRKPVTGYGDIIGSLLLVGLAPAASGANRTGRVFTGDKSSEFLMECLYSAGITSMNSSLKADDGLEYINTYISLAVRCVPPENKPDKREVDNCLSFLEREIRLMKNLKVILCMGKLAFDSTISALSRLDFNVKGFRFSNGFVQKTGNLVIMAVFHPSPRNVNTGRITKDEFTDICKKAKKFSIE